MNLKKSTKNKPYFIQLVIQSKAAGDYRAFVYYRPIFNTAKELEIRGYGNNLAEAAADAISKWEKVYNE